jgi:hypothetical protein
MACFIVSSMSYCVLTDFNRYPIMNNFLFLAKTSSGFRLIKVKVKLKQK